MFSEEAYAKLKSSREFRGFSRNCYIGFLASYLIAVLLAAIVQVIAFNKLFGHDPVKIILVSLPVYIAGFIACIIAIRHSLKKKKPYLCEYGTVVSKSGKYAVISVRGKQIKGSSFENFLRNASLDEYKPGDTVLIYSQAEKNGRPLFSGNIG